MDFASGSIDLTPTRAVTLGGWQGRRQPTSDVGSAIEGNVLALRAGRTAVIVSIDALFIGAPLHQSLLEVARRHGVREQDLVVAASHSHCAPMLDPAKPSLGIADAAHAADVSARMCALLDHTLAGPFRPGVLRHGSGTGRFAISRRGKRWRLDRHGLHKRCVSAPDLERTEPESVHVVTVQDASGHVEAVLWSAACHPVGWPNREQISSDFPGDVRTRLRASFGGAHLPVIFLQGCSADLRPRTEPLTAPMSIGRWMHAEYFLLYPTRATYDIWLNRVWDVVDAAARQAMSREPMIGDVRSSALTLPLSDFFEGPGASESLRFHAIMLGDGHAVLGGTGELPVDVRHLIERAFAGVEVIPAGCINDCFGYLPSTRMLVDRGYEVEGWLKTFGLPWRARLSGDPDGTILDALTAMRPRID